MIEAIINQPFSAVLYGADAGALFDVRVMSLDNVIIPDGVATVEESVDTPGLYIASFPEAPAVPSTSYIVVWEEQGTGETFAEDFWVRDATAEVAVAGIAPGIAELAVFMKNRTKSRYGGVIGTFNADTPLTDTDINTLISQAVDEVTLAVGSNLPDGPESDPDLYRRGAKNVVLLTAAMNVEIALSGEQVNDPRSPYSALERRANALRKTLVEAVSEARGVYGGGGESDAADNNVTNEPAYGFPPPTDTGTRRF